VQGKRCFVSLSHLFITASLWIGLSALPVNGATGHSHASPRDKPSARHSGQITGLPATPARDWWQGAPVNRTKYYNIKTDFPREDAKIMGEHMDAVFKSYMMLFSKLPLRLQRPAVLNLFLFVEEADYQKVLRERFHNNGTGSWGKCITAGHNISLVGWRGRHSLEQMKPLLQHEGFHQVASHLFPRMPIWANEGLAELFERGIMVDGQLVLGDFPESDKRRLLKCIEQGKMLPLDRFFALDSAAWSGRVHAGDAVAQYLQAWSMIHFLLFADQRKHESGFLKFLVALNRRVEWREAFVTSFGVPNFQVMETKWKQYVRDTPPSDYRETVRRLKFLAAGLSELRKQNRYPSTIAELREQLESIDFGYDLEIFGRKRRLDVHDSRLFDVPLAEGIPRRKFTLTKPRNSPTGQRYDIVATGLAPQTFSAHWSRRGRGSGYIISAKPSAKQKQAQREAKSQSQP